MPYSSTTAVQRIAALDRRLKIIQGGSSAGKTIAILLILIDIAQSSPKRRLISVVGESVPFLKRGALRDFLNIMKEHNYYKEENWNRTDFIYTFETGTVIEFFSADNPGKVRGPRRDILFINECNHVPYESYTQLAIRTNESIYLDYNPSSSFYVHEELIPNQDPDFLILTYKDNEALPQMIIDELESRKTNKAFWQVYGLGQLGEVEGRIYTGWRVIDEVPHEARLERRGLDFGYSRDPAALVDVYYYNGGYILDEQLYRTGMLNKPLADYISNLPQPHTLVVADSAEPKSIDEIKLNGIVIQPAEKGPDSITYGIQKLQGMQISMTKRSVNLIKEYRSYMWKFDRDGRQLTVPEPGNDHALDAVRYALTSTLAKVDIKPFKPKAMMRQKYGR
jgi:phage terminase large subunit